MASGRRKRGDKETRRQGDKPILSVVSPCLPVSLSPCLGSNPQSLIPNPSSRRGMLLLVVLALLALFPWSAWRSCCCPARPSGARRASERIGAGPIHDRPLAEALESSDPRTPAQLEPIPASIIGAHSLLEDMYGNDWVRERSQHDDGAAIRLARRDLVTRLQWQRHRGKQVPGRTRPSRRLRADDYRVPSGSTARNRPLGQSTRIVGVNPGCTTVQVICFPDGSNGSRRTAPLSSSTACRSAEWGSALACPAGSLQEQRPVGAQRVSLALLPNDPSEPQPELGAGANSDYTAADFQHMLLAAQVAGVDASTTRRRTSGLIGRYPRSTGPALLRYWENRHTQRRKVDTAGRNLATMADAAKTWRRTASTSSGRQSCGRCRTIIPISPAAIQRTIRGQHRRTRWTVKPLGRSESTIRGRLAASHSPGTSTTTATGCRTAFGSIWACRSARRPTAGCTSRCSPSSASISTAG